MPLAKRNRVLDLCLVNGTLGVGIFASAGSIPRVFILAATVFLLLVGARQSCVERKNWLRADGSIWWLLALLTTSLILYVVKRPVKHSSC